MTPSDPAAIAADVRKILAEVGAQGDVATVGNDDSLLASGVLDSMAMVGLVSAIEARFGIAISEQELSPEHFDSVSAIAALVAQKTGGR
jgi:acyl carrier protein